MTKTPKPTNKQGRGEKRVRRCQLDGGRPEPCLLDLVFKEMGIKVIDVTPKQ